MFRGSPVAGLFSAGRPLAVAFFVVAIVVFPIERLSGRPFPHVGEEVYEGKPSLANRDPAPAVPAKGFMVCACATINHARPRMIRWTAPSIKPRVPMLPWAGFAVQTATRLRMAVDEGAYRDDFVSSAVAATDPLPLPARGCDCGVQLNDDEPSVAASYDIDGGGHGDLSRRLLCLAAVEPPRSAVAQIILPLVAGTKRLRPQRAADAGEFAA
jgi:hypothetical protein